MRTLPEWIGASHDSPVPPRVKGRVYDRQDGRCAICTRECHRGLRPAYDHIKALINGGENRESNLQLLCVPCHAKKTWADLKEKSTVARKRNKHLGIATKPKRPISSRGFDKSEPQRTASRPIERRSSGDAINAWNVRIHTQEARVPKVRTSHHRNKEEAARLQELVDKRYAPAQCAPEPDPQIAYESERAEGWKRLGDGQS